MPDKILGSDALKHALNSGSVFHPNGLFFSDMERSSIENRLIRYRKFWKAYEASARAKSDDSTEDSDINICRLVAKKTKDWLFGKSWQLVCDPGNEEIRDLVEEIWQDNEKDLICQLCAHQGAVTGDAYFHVTLDTSVVEDTNAAPIVINPVPAQFVHPLFDPFISRRISGAMIQYPIHVLQTDKGELMVHPTSLSSFVGSMMDTYYTQYVTASEVLEYYGEVSTNTETNQNYFGEVNVFHCQNMVSGNSLFGESDLEDIYKVDRQLTRLSDKIAEVVDLFAGPTTVVTGATADTLEPGAGNIWSIRSPEAKVYTLVAGGDLAGANQHFTRIREMSAEMGGVPLSAVGSLTSMSNTSGAALEVLFMPLLEKTRSKYVTYGSLLKQVSGFIARILVKRDPSILSRLTRPERFDKFTIKFASPIPRDEDSFQKRILEQYRDGVLSKKETIDALADSAVNIQSRYMNVLADERQTLLKEYEKFKAAEGGMPNITSVRTGSVGINLENQEVLDEQDKVMLSALKKVEKVKQKTASEETANGEREEPEERAVPAGSEKVPADE
jgi:hypothetical protein